MKHTKKGFTLIETIAGIGLVGAATTGLISTYIEQSKEDSAELFLREAKSLVQAFDHRISIDGYDSSLWSSQQWIDKNDVINDLIKKELVSSNSSECSGGIWNPSLNSDSTTKLISCHLWNHPSKTEDFFISAEINNDSTGFIQNFNLDIEFNNDEVFEEHFKYIKPALNKIKIDTQKKMSGSHFFEFMSKNTNELLSSRECIDEKSDCFIRMSFERSGGGEYLKDNGSNSIIGEKLTFVETKGQSTMKCIRWKNTQSDGTGTWSQTIDEECGVGIYKDLNHPAVVDVVVESGTFEHVLLDQECNLFQANANGTVTSSINSSPCGMLNGSEAIQVVDNIQANLVLSEDANFNILNLNKLISNDISTSTLTVSNLAKLKSAKIDGNLSINSSMNNMNSITGSGTFKAPIGDFNNINNEISTLKTSVNNLNNSFNNIMSSWYVGSWGSCNTSCGNGTQYRSVSCPNNKICNGNKPSTSRSCSSSSGCWTSPGNKGDNSGNDGPNR